VKVREIRLQDFKRFSKTTVTDIPSTARLVMLVGPNGSGKSSLIDAAFTWHHNHWRGIGRTWDDSYHRKQAAGTAADWRNAIAVEFHDPQPHTPEDKKRAVYARTAYRNEPEFALGSLSKVTSALDEHRFGRLIDNDQAVSTNYKRLVADGFRDVYETADGNMTISEFRERSIGEIRDAMSGLFPGLLLNSLGNPLDNGTFRFDKGDASGFEYKNLSGGEKAAFDILLDLLVKRREYRDTVFFIDEPEAHMSPALQSGLLDAMLKVIPENSQLWLASHSIGMMRRARELERQHPGTVVFIDFEGVNFDLQQVLKPILPDRPFWRRAMRIAFDDLAGYVAPEQVVLCEGGGVSRGGDFDADCYNVIFSASNPQAVFLGAGNADEISNDPRGVQRLLRALAPDVAIVRLIDRDDRTDQEIHELSDRGVKVLPHRTIESYLLDDQVLTLLCEELGNPDAIVPLLEEKRRALANSIEAGGPPDDLKRVAGDVYVAAKRLFPEIKLGSDKRAFMKGMCAPVLTRVPLFDDLRRAIFS
jgi:predicted ATPase